MNRTAKRCISLRRQQDIRHRSSNSWRWRFNYPVYQESYEYVDNKKSKIKRLLTFKMEFSAAEGTNIIPDGGSARPVHFYRKKARHGARCDK